VFCPPSLADGPDGCIDGFNLGPLQFLRKVRLQALARSHQVRLAHDIISVEDGSGLVTAEGHCNSLWHPRSDKVANGCPPQIVNYQRAKFGLLESRLPGLPEAADRMSL
jgi:hypothetical protein